jgi:hypothetical protein
LGSLADEVGLRVAHWLVPVLTVGALCAFVIGRALKARPS